MEDTATACPFCAPPSERHFYTDRLVIGLWDSFPVSPGHALLVPKRHIASWFEATAEEKAALVAAIDIAKAAIDRTHNPDAYNIGVNIGAEAGQTIFHLHVHVIPRFKGDVTDPRGGVRYVVPKKANYLSGVEDSEQPNTTITDRLLFTGRSVEPFEATLKDHFASAAEVDIAVAFVMRSGVTALQASISEALSRGTRVRLLTGDYLGATDPVALIQLLDFESQQGSIQLRVYQTEFDKSPSSGLATSFHPKAYIFVMPNGGGTAFIGSSNLSKSALSDGVEWNYRVISSRDGQGFQEARTAFDRLFHSPATTALTEDWIEDYKGRRRALVPATDDAPFAPPLEPIQIPEPHGIQREALEALQRSRDGGAEAGLVVLATGLGKTWLSAFDSRESNRVLFVAHREEILDQAMRTYRRIRPNDYLGRYDGEARHPNANVLFASIQTLSRRAHLDRFTPDRFDYIVVDEFHHASAATYRRLLQHFQPRFLLGLTATPERSDGANLLELCGGNLVYRCDLTKGVSRDLLCPFDYFGVPDEVDYSNIPWRSTKFDEERLTTAVATISRAENALQQLDLHGGKRALAFCVSQRHADFMSAFFVGRGKRAVPVHSGPSSAPRTISLEKLQAGELDIVCAVDMFNEGVDLPDLDTVMMLRPTESKILWLQQFGRGLRRSTREKRLKVIDYIGNHRIFLLKLRTLFNLPAGDAAIQNLLERLRTDTAELPPGCSVTYDLKTIDIIKGLLRASPLPSSALRAYVQDFRDLNGVRPTANEVFRDGFDPRTVRSHFGSWFGFLKSVGALDASELAALDAQPEFLSTLEVTPMTRSYKMVTLLAMLDENALPGAIGLSELTSAVRRIGHAQPRVVADFGAHFSSESELRKCLTNNPIDAWVRGAGTSGQHYFEYADDRFSTSMHVPTAETRSFQALARELVDWRITEYFDNPVATKPDTFLIKVNQAKGRPILMPLNRDRHRTIPDGWAPFVANGRSYEGSFQKIAMNVARKSNSPRNELPSLLRSWFGPDAGAPGTRHFVQLSCADGEWTITPYTTDPGVPVLWKAYSREQIPGLFGLEFNASVWQKGFVRRGNRTFLLVTLDKTTAAKKHKYQDKFLTAKAFQWQSQNQTRSDKPSGQSIKFHKSKGIEVLLFVRLQAKTKDNKASPFFYCGPVDFEDWNDKDEPITVFWRLAEEVPDRLRNELRVPE